MCMRVITVALYRLSYPKEDTTVKEDFPFPRLSITWARGPSAKNALGSL